jgi:hypothetical protein
METQPMAVSDLKYHTLMAEMAWTLARLILGAKDEQGRHIPVSLSTQAQKINGVTQEGRRNLDGTLGGQLQRRSRDSTNYAGNIRIIILSETESVITVYLGIECN